MTNQKLPVCAVTGVGPGNGEALAKRFAGDGYAAALGTGALAFALAAPAVAQQSYQHHRQMRYRHYAHHERYQHYRTAHHIVVHPRVAYQPPRSLLDTAGGPAAAVGNVVGGVTVSHSVDRDRGRRPDKNNSRNRQGGDQERRKRSNKLIFSSPRQRHLVLYCVLYTTR
jgi:hypothetical protein